ncbi:putative Prefoldin subunit [Monocercomonoides exilis]|uniref:putative Prefoldin subunit n=1 Tax=Monocercomonoides exilis TaxID=2049356 RepID=UPI0035595080|nr:putative Prefoldin subunit [Monocercomonoides exilis]|eukprot:MONOS_5157.1-p1 / transcript=MONOS_5157.1 / gene=MONOS_5157 / organism=Monocercomonoides_exilis_PA203 / gene_product=unspecified product / transcript_product=unspecified product / location=Mono_scaffold00147:21756-22320(+) / protein_length=123 / sequence_SO=supercontig / SO=protein_coding / is_pseudo=false
MSKGIQIPPEQFQEIQKLGIQISQINMEINQTAAKLWYHGKEVKKSNIVLKEISQIPDGVTMYRAVGRMFLHTPQKLVKEQLENKITEDEKEVSSLDQKQQYLTKQKTEMEKSLRELVAMITK